MSMLLVCRNFEKIHFPSMLVTVTFCGLCTFTFTPCAIAVTLSLSAEFVVPFIAFGSSMVKVCSGANSEPL